MLVSAQTGDAVTPAQLLGEAKEERDAKALEAARKLKRLEKKMAKAGIKLLPLRAE